MDPKKIPKSITINGRFLTQKISGVQRYSRELVKALDRIIENEPNYRTETRWRLMVPPGADTSYRLNAIRIETVGNRGGHLWEQYDLLRASRRDRLINLGNSAPLLHRNKFVIIHDVAIFRTPQNFGWRYRTGHKVMGRIIARNSDLGTVSQFSQAEISRLFCRPLKSINVITNGCDHLLNRATDDTVLHELDIECGKYFLFVGNPTPNKNLSVLLEAFHRAQIPRARLVLVGSLNSKVFPGSPAAYGPDIVLAPHRTDEEVASLYANAKAFVFPSLYEGFGIPPLEAMAQGCPVIAADIPVVREVCGEAVAYFPPTDPDTLADLLRHHWNMPFDRVSQGELVIKSIEKFQWSNSARSLLDLIFTDRTQQ
ncbi:glycosyltransferase family 1 protein [uncultured Novosphingobium sp.]|uniref:glycosyltransferase family 4 protein n=1 Tax=uncultured Novosphingobium sp. TaxID=292277 RepID=UPI00258B61D4|nr:glycosyltransferase family 1 protein [uncultured Novosphingobium sp.]